MVHSLGFTPIDVKDIGKALSGLFDFLDGKEAFTRASASNVVVAGASLDDLDRVLDVVQLLALAHPARFFIPVIDSSVATLQAAVTTVCIRVSGAASVCSEIVKLQVPENLRQAAPSILRANYLPGITCEVVVAAWDEFAAQLVKAGDLSFFDSRDLKDEETTQLLAYLSTNNLPAVDFNWVRLGFWREEFRRIFDRKSLQSLVSRISSIVIRSRVPEGREIDFGAYLLAGWFADRLRIEPVSYSRNGWECRTRGRTAHETVEIRIEKAPGTEPGIQGVEVFARSGTEANVERVVTCSRGKDLETMIYEDPTIVTHRGLEREDLESVIDRYFLVGESIFNYEAAQRIAREMYQLTRGF